MNIILRHTLATRFAKRVGGYISSPLRRIGIRPLIDRT